MKYSTWPETAAMLRSRSKDGLREFVDFIDFLYAENGVALGGGDASRLALFSAVWRLEGVACFCELLGMPEEEIEPIAAAIERYHGLMEGAPGSERDEALKAHAEVLAALRGELVSVEGLE